MSLTLPVSATAASAIAGVSALSNLILVNPQVSQGITAQAITFSDGSQSPSKSFLFHYEGEQSLMLENDITDHYVEDNTALQDQIAQRPMLIATHGYIGELNDVVPAILQPLALAASKLTALTAYAPQLSVAALLALNTATQAYQVAQQAAAAAASVASVVPGLSGISGTLGNFANQNQQQQAFNFFRGYLINNGLFTVQTPWGIFQNMAIKSLRPVQDADTLVITDFDVTFKQMRFAESLFLAPLIPQGRFANQSASLVNNGVSGTIPAPSLLDSNSPGASLLGGI